MFWPILPVLKAHWRIRRFAASMVKDGDFRYYRPLDDAGKQAIRRARKRLRLFRRRKL